MYGQHALSTADLAGAAGVLFVGGDQSALAAPVGESRVPHVRANGGRRAPVVMTDRAMTAAMGSWYSALPEPTPTDAREPGGGRLPHRLRDRCGPGLASLPGVALEPRLTVDYRWGRLYGLARAHPDAIVFGLCQDTAIVLDGSSADLAGGLSAVSLDARTATFAAGGNGALAAFNVLLNTYAPGDSIS